MIISSVFEFFAIATLLCLNPQESRSHDAAAPVKVTYAVVMGQNEPISAEVSCPPDVACELVDHADPAVHLAITMYSDLKGVSCASIAGLIPVPSGVRDRASIFQAGELRPTSLGESDFGIAVPLVVRRRPIFGEALVSY
ncbi:hypothetical protein PYR71_12635 [Rhizobium sp. MC63]|uniref:Uncharacterized protein n=1 Tax=Rhizobium mulingense TaxID=3031128 RepID=A0ACC6MUF0_9HYPH|nr:MULTISPECIES: hypothetical protein [unclassified Rhizobium]MDF0697334.1 hypothetical protein [Rhizobium sp. MC63]MEA3517001.1 hypothetical protein [Rhizobium sp. MJ31]